MPDEEKKPDGAEAPMADDGGPDEGGGDEAAGKIVDEDWKAEVRREKEKLEKKIEKEPEKKPEEKPEEGSARAGERELPPPDFLHFISGIAAQTLMQLGDIENPFAGERKVDLDSARYSIDLLQMLEEKTKGNLAPDEERYLKAALHDLRMRYVDAASGKGPTPGPGEGGPTV